MKLMSYNQESSELHRTPAGLCGLVCRLSMRHLGVQRLEHESMWAVRTAPSTHSGNVLCSGSLGRWPLFVQPRGWLRLGMGA